MQRTASGGHEAGQPLHAFSHPLGTDVIGGTTTEERVMAQEVIMTQRNVTSTTIEGISQPIHCQADLHRTRVTPGTSSLMRGCG